MIGKSLIHYEISAEIGRGGMGEVYQAKDTKLGRDVAIKVLPEEFALDKDRVARFQREAKLLASLNHPNIAAIYGLEESEGTHFLVMELIEGDTLRDRIKTGPIPVEEALNLALQMAEALEAAHENGVIHRDLKPANIKVTPNGKVKILDFGLAKAYTGDAENSSPADSPTLSAAATRQGIILGTAAYMSPEQARGKPVDKRADIWAFGVVLFEMLTGKSLFSGEDVTSTVARVLEREPDFSTLPQNLHPRIRLLLERCLKKDPKNRYSGISDARVDVQEVLADPSGLFLQTVATAERQTGLRSIIPWIASILGILIVGAAVWYLKPSQPPEPKRIIYLEYNLPDDQQLHLSADGRGFIDVSPDGNQFVYSTKQGLYLRSVDKFDSRSIPGSEDLSESPFFSPDGKWVGYYSPSDEKLKKIAITGGVPIPLCDASGAFSGGQWLVDNTIIFSTLWRGIMEIPDSGGTPEPLFNRKTNISTESRPFRGVPALPNILPDQENVLFTDISDLENMQIVVQSIKTGEAKILFPGMAARYLPTGHILYGLSEDNITKLYAIPFDLDRLEATGGAFPLLEGISSYSVSESGTFVYVMELVTAAESDVDIRYANPQNATLVWVDRDGKEESLGAPPDRYRQPKISPDGTRVALSISDKNSDIWIWDLNRNFKTPLIRDEGNDITPIWTPDGDRIVYTSVRKGGIYWKNADGTGESELLITAPDRFFWPYSWADDGKTLVMKETTDGVKVFDIGILSMEGDHTRKPLLQEDFGEIEPQVSPDGKWIAYCSDESGKMEIWVRPYPDVEKSRFQVSTDGGINPLWSTDGKELFYMNLDSNETAVVAVKVETEPTFKAGSPETLFKGPYPISSWPWDIHPKGKRFLIMKRIGAEIDESAAASPHKITIVLNGFEELKQRVPVD